MPYIGLKPANTLTGNITVEKNQVFFDNSSLNGLLENEKRNIVEDIKKGYYSRQCLKPTFALSRPLDPESGSSLSVYELFVEQLRKYEKSLTSYELELEKYNENLKTIEIQLEQRLASASKITQHVNRSKMYGLAKELAANYEIDSDLNKFRSEYELVKVTEIYFKLAELLLN